MRGQATRYLNEQGVHFAGNAHGPALPAGLRVVAHGEKEAVQMGIVNDGLQRAIHEARLPQVVQPPQPHTVPLESAIGPERNQEGGVHLGIARQRLQEAGPRVASAVTAEDDAGGGMHRHCTLAAVVLQAVDASALPALQAHKAHLLAVAARLGLVQQTLPILFDKLYRHYRHVRALVVLPPARLGRR